MLFNPSTGINQQVAILTGSIATLTHTLASSNDSIGGMSDGGTKSAIEATIIQACNRLEGLLGDARLWGEEKAPPMDESDKAMYDLQMDTLVKNRDTVIAQAKPHVLLKPSLFRLQGLWWAIYGGTIENRLAGCGRTPYEAMLNFDKNYESEKPLLDNGTNEGSAIPSTPH